MNNQDKPHITEQEKALLTYEVAEAAKSQIIIWAKWIIGTFALVVAILGIKTYIDVQSKIDTTIDNELLKAKEKTIQAIEQFETEKTIALSKLENAINEANAAITLKTQRAHSRIDVIIATLPDNLSGSNKVLIRNIYDAENTNKLPGILVRSEGQDISGDPVVDRVYENIGIVNDFLSAVFNYDLTKDVGNEVIATVHYNDKFNNGFWNGNQIVLGDGDGTIFKDLSSLDIVAGELTNSLLSSKLLYRGEPGALHQHLRDILSTMIVQWHRKQKVEEASWLIGNEVLAKKIKGEALRSLKMPGEAYDDPLLGKDPQPNHMNNYVITGSDNEGVHINSGIPNHAFYLAATSLGGYSWGNVGKIWFTSIDHLHHNMTFKEFANLTLDIAKKTYGQGSREAEAVNNAWLQVGIVISNSLNKANQADAKIRAVD